MVLEKVKIELIERGIAEQLMRKAYVEGKLKKLDTKMDLVNESFLKKVVSYHGLPTISKFGEDAACYAELIVLHASDLNFQKKYLSLMENKQEDVHRKNYERLTDKICLKEGRPQVFNTQSYIDPKDSRYRDKLQEFYKKK